MKELQDKTMELIKEEYDETPSMQVTTRGNRVAVKVFRSLRDEDVSKQDFPYYSVPGASNSGVPGFGTNTGIRK